MKLACQLAAFGFLLYAIASAPLTHILNPTTPAAAAVPRSFQEEERRAAAQEGVSGQDKSFLMTAAEGEMLQLELSKVAIKHAKTLAVRRFAGQTAQFIDRAEIRLSKVASEFGLSLPAAPSGDVQHAAQLLAGTQNIDREYLLRIIADAEAATHLYKEEASSGKNPVVAQYARELLPRLSQHYRNALRLSAAINAPVAAAKRDHIPASHKS